MGSNILQSPSYGAYFSCLGMWENLIPKSHLFYQSRWTRTLICTNAVDLARKITRRVSLADQEMLTLQENIVLPPYGQDFLQFHLFLYFVFSIFSIGSWSDMSKYWYMLCLICFVISNVHILSFAICIEMLQWNVIIKYYSITGFPALIRYVYVII